MIDKTGQRWTGENFVDLAEYVTAYSSRNYRADDIRQSRCGTCQGTVFGLVIDDTEGCAQRTCGSCSASAFICDSAEYWDQADPGEAECPCGGGDFETAVGFSFIERGEIRWITVGGRCVRCGVLGVYAEWKVDYEPSRQLLDLT